MSEGGIDQNTEKACERGALTSYRAQREGHVRTVNQGQKETSTHFLFSTEEGTSKNPEKARKQRIPTNCRARRGGTHQDAESKPAGEEHSHPIGCGVG
jgi:hypothetical protein